MSPSCRPTFFIIFPLPCLIAEGQLAFSSLTTWKTWNIKTRSWEPVHSIQGLFLDVLPCVSFIFSRPGAGSRSIALFQMALFWGFLKLGDPQSSPWVSTWWNGLMTSNDWDDWWWLMIGGGYPHFGRSPYPSHYELTTNWVPQSVAAVSCSVQPRPWTKLGERMVQIRQSLQLTQIRGSYWKISSNEF